MTPIEAARALRKHIDAATCRKLPRVALEQAILAVMKGRDPVAVAEMMAEAV